MRRFYQQFLSGLWIIIQIHQIFSEFLWGRVIPPRNVTLQIKKAALEEAPWRPCPGPQREPGVSATLRRWLWQQRLQAQARRTFSYWACEPPSWTGHWHSWPASFLCVDTCVQTEQVGQHSPCGSHARTHPGAHLSPFQVAEGAGLWTGSGRAGTAFRILRSPSCSEAPFLSKNLAGAQAHLI